MSQENVEIVRAVHGGWARGDFRVAQELFAFVWTVQGGRLARLAVFTDREQALEAAGLSE
jgi:ketosteroid isomerase-like protein